MPICVAMLAFEPIVLATSLYHAFVYSLLFIFLEVNYISFESMLTFDVFHFRLIHMYSRKLTILIYHKMVWFLSHLR